MRDLKLQSKRTTTFPRFHVFTVSFQSEANSGLGGKVHVDFAPINKLIKRRNSKNHQALVLTTPLLEFDFPTLGIRSYVSQFSFSTILNIDTVTQLFMSLPDWKKRIFIDIRTPFVLLSEVRDREYVHTRWQQQQTLHFTREMSVIHWHCGNRQWNQSLILRQLLFPNNEERTQQLIFLIRKWHGHTRLWYIGHLLPRSSCWKWPAKTTFYGTEQNNGKMLRNQKVYKSRYSSYFLYTVQIYVVSTWGHTESGGCPFKQGHGNWAGGRFVPGPVHSGV